MSNYTKLTDFASKDALPTGSPSKIVKGTEIDDELQAIENAIVTKADINSPTLTGTPTAPTATAGTNTTQVATTAFVTGAVSTETTARQAALDALVLVPSGAVMAFAMSTAPTAWLKCDGSAVSRTTYSDLFSAIGTTYGEGDGSTTFNLPDMRGEFLRGWDDGKGTDSGRLIGSAQSDEIASHSHPTYGTESGYRHPVRLGSDAIIDGSSASASADDAHYDVNSRTDTTGGSETRPRNIAMLYCIKV